MKSLAAFVHLYGWEFIQNLPFVAGSVAGMRLWSTGHAGAAVVIGLAGCVASAALITLTEPRKLQHTAGQSKPSRELGPDAQIRELVTNSLAFAGGSLAAAWYVGWVTQFGSLPHTWAADMAVGGLAGAAVAMVQNGMAPRPAGARPATWPHVAAFALMGPVILVVVRALIHVTGWPAVAGGSLGLAAVMTLIICFVEYRPGLKAE